MRTLLSAAAIAALPISAAADPVADLWGLAPTVTRVDMTNRPEGSDCACRYFGNYIPLGQQICMRSGGRWLQATCVLVLNNTHWRIEEDSPCAPGSA